MKPRHIASMVISSSVLVAGITLAAQDRWTLKSLSGISFAEVKGYDSWQMVASSVADDESGCGTSKAPGCIKSIVGNRRVDQGVQGRHSRQRQARTGRRGVRQDRMDQGARHHAPYGAFVPGPLAEVSFMMKDSRRFPKTDGWGYATFQYDTATDTWTAKGDNPEFVNACHGCHTVVKARDFVFTDYPKR